jgi:D-alanyl-lipoteichoic acid acyltransferase DltB (MBOAT superfamily)
MLFNSYAFWGFFACVFATYWRLRHRHQNLLLLAASYVFYGLWDWRFLGLILLSTVVDYIAARRLEQASAPAARRRWLGLSLVTNLGILGVFKYYDFFAGELTALLGGLGLEAAAPTLDLVLPVGISFYTFQTLSYTVDVYRGELAPVRDFLDFALFVCFFPQLVAGPIERAGRLLPQVRTPRARRDGDFAAGLYLVAYGLWLKVVVADNLAEVADAVFAAPPEAIGGLEVLLGVYAFAFQIYGDFGGYSAVARGVARWLGFDLSPNFRRPYFATSPSELWRRWHISLSSWLRDYLYIPLGGNRGGRLRTARNLVATMSLGGLWHGAGWNFIAWGVFHGVLLTAYRPLETASRRLRESGAGGTRVLAAVTMFHATCVGWLFFRASDLPHALALAGRLGSGLAPTPLAAFLAALIVFFAGPLLAFDLWAERAEAGGGLPRASWLSQALFYGFVAMVLLHLTPSRSHEFIYFQF